MDASGRRQYSEEFKRRLAKMALEPGASVAGIALAHRINANPLFKWRQDYLRQRDRMTSDATARELAPPPVSPLEATLLPGFSWPSWPRSRARRARRALSLIHI